MKKIVFLIAILMLTKPLWPVAEYAINYDYIVETLCENRDKPEMECNGKCYLTKQLANENSDKEDSNKPLKIEIPQHLAFEHLQVFEISPARGIDQGFQPIGYSQNLHSTIYASKIPHPPRFS